MCTIITPRDMPEWDESISSLYTEFTSLKHNVNLLLNTFGDNDELIRYVKNTLDRTHSLQALLYISQNNFKPKDKILLDDLSSALISLDKAVRPVLESTENIFNKRFRRETQSLLEQSESIVSHINAKYKQESKNIPTDNTAEVTHPKQGMILSEYVREYLKYIQTNNAPKTYDTYSYSLKLFQNHVGDKLLSDLVSRDLESFKEMRKKTVGDTTINMDIRAINAAMTTAVDWDLLENNPFHKVKLIKIAKQQPIYLRKKEFDKVCKKIPNQKILDIVIFAVNTGLRPGELCNLKWEDIDLKKHTMRIQSSTVYRVKHGMMRIVPLNDAALNILKKEGRNSGFVFPNRKGDLLDSDYVSRKFKKAVRDAGLSEEIKFRHTRSTFACWAVSSGVSVYAVKQILGHSSVSTTEIYSQFDENILMDEITKVRPIGESESIDEKTLEDVLSDDDA